MTSDKLASAYALERRPPYLARDLIEFSYRLPAEHRISDPALGKRILPRRSARAPTHRAGGAAFLYCRRRPAPRRSGR
ncbi:asparagine synthase [Actinobacteria bacterium OV450]|nr:asparagine synthase [Actinobacteria bacterium OV450]